MVTSERKRKSRATKSRSDQLEAKKLYMRNYRDENANKKDTEAEAEEEKGEKKKTTETDAGDSNSMEKNLASVLEDNMK